MAVQKAQSREGSDGPTRERVERREWDLVPRVYEPTLTLRILSPGPIFPSPSPQTPTFSGYGRRVFRCVGPPIRLSTLHGKLGSLRRVTTFMSNLTCLHVSTSRDQEGLP